jgi:L-alanine-DL-glutamate epimerase-like enolase superfamily enzyme
MSDSSLVISDVRTRTFSYTAHVARAYGHSHPSPPRTARQVLLEIHTKGGAIGYAFGLDPGVVEGVVAPVLLGENALYRERIWQRLSEFQRGSGALLSDAMLAVVDVALWDLAGRVAGLSVSQMLGSFRDRLPAYASTMCGDVDRPGGLSTPEEYADFAEQCQQEGYPAFKIHPWMPPLAGPPSVDRDIAVCVAVRERVGPTMELMLDPYHQYSRQEAKRLAQAIHELGYLWIEEPMREASISSYRWLTDQVEIDIVGPETAGGQIWTRAEWVRAGACDILRAGILDVGGITPLMKAIHLAEANGMSIEIHDGGAATLQVLGAMQIPGRYYERGLLHPLVDHSARTPWLAALEDPIDADGFVSIPSTPGVGWEIDWDFITANELER